MHEALKAFEKRVEFALDTVKRGDLPVEAVIQNFQLFRGGVDFGSMLLSLLFE